MRLMRCFGYLSVALIGSMLLGTPARAELIAHWKLDDGLVDPDTTTAVDSVSPASNGTLQNFSNPADKWGAGIAGGALEFGDWHITDNNKGPAADDVVTIP